jgi:uncharacterized protein
MEIRGSYSFDAPVATVWDLLMDPRVVCECLPGCKSLTPVGEDRYEAILALAVASITGTYKGTIAIADKQPPHSYTMTVEGSGAPGFVQGRSTITLTDEGGRTRVDVAGDVQVGGTVARVGQRLLAGVSKMMMDRFWACLRAKAGAPGNAR